MNTNSQHPRHPNFRDWSDARSKGIGWRKRDIALLMFVFLTSSYFGWSLLGQVEALSWLKPSGRRDVTFVGYLLTILFFTLPATLLGEFILKRKRKK